MPAFSGKNVVSAASSQGVHGFQADAHAHQAAQKSRRHKAQKLAAAKDHEFRAKAGNFFKMTGCQVFKAPAWPVLSLTTRTDEHAAVNLFCHPWAGQSDPARAIAKNGLDFKTIWLEFHAVLGWAAWPIWNERAKGGCNGFSLADGRLVFAIERPFYVVKLRIAPECSPCCCTACGQADSVHTWSEGFKHANNTQTHHQICQARQCLL